MTKEMKVIDILNTCEVIKALMDDKSMDIDVALKFKLLGILKSLETHQANFELLRNEKIKEYGTKSEDGSISISEDDVETMKKFQNEIGKILAVETEVDIDMLSPTEVFNSGIKSAYLTGLYPLISQA